MPADPQAAVRQLRGRLLGGRGPGAPPAEVDAYTSERTVYAGRPVAEQLEALHERTAATRGDTAAMRRSLDRTRDRLAADVDQIAARVSPHRRHGQPRQLLAVLGVLVLLAILRSCWRSR